MDAAAISLAQMAAKIMGCDGCTKIIYGQEHFHCGADLVQLEDGLYAVQDPDEDSPSIAVLVRPEDGWMSFVLPQGLPKDVARPALEEMLKQQGGMELTPTTARQACEVLRAKLQLAVVDGALVRDYNGRWHLIGVV